MRTVNTQVIIDARCSTSTRRHWKSAGRIWHDKCDENIRTSSSDVLVMMRFMGSHVLKAKILWARYCSKLRFLWIFIQIWELVHMWVLSFLVNLSLIARSRTFPLERKVKWFIVCLMFLFMVFLRTRLFRFVVESWTSTPQNMYCSKRVKLSSAWKCPQILRQKSSSLRKQCHGSFRSRNKSHDGTPRSTIAWKSTFDALRATNFDDSRWSQQEIPFVVALATIGKSACARETSGRATLFLSFRYSVCCHIYHGVHGC